MHNFKIQEYLVWWNGRQSKEEVFAGCLLFCPREFLKTIQCVLTTQYAPHEVGLQYSPLPPHLGSERLALLMSHSTLHQAAHFSFWSQCPLMISLHSLDKPVWSTLPETSCAFLTSDLNLSCGYIWKTVSSMNGGTILLSSPLFLWCFE